AAYGHHAAGSADCKRYRLTLTPIEQASATPGAKCSTEIGTEVHDHKNGPQRRPVKQRDGFGRYRDTTSPLRKTIDQHKGIQGPVGRRLTEDEQQHKTRDGAAHRHT